MPTATERDEGATKLNPAIRNRTPEDSETLTAAISVRLTEKDAERLRTEAERQGFSTTGAYVREMVLWSLAVPNERTLLLETVLRVEFLMAECFKAVAPNQEDVDLVEGLQQRAEAVSRDLLTRFVTRRGSLDKAGVASGT